MPRTGTQIQIMVGLIFLSVIVMMGYAIFDTSRANDAEEEQVTVAGERGAELFSVNCRRCHGLEGRGVAENAEAFPGAVLNDESLRPDDPTALEGLQARYFSTIECGRVGTLMPAWSLDEGGNLTDQQISDLVTFITENPSDAWAHMIEYGEEHDPTGVTLAEDLSADATEFELDGDELELQALTPPVRIRIDDELILVTTAAIEADREAAAAAEDAEEAEEDGEAGEEDSEEAADPDTEEAEGGESDTPTEAETGGDGDATATPTPAATSTGTDPTDDTSTEEGGEEGESSAAAGSDEVILLRGYQGSEVSEHEAGATIYNTPPEAGDDLTGEPPSTPPCGQIFMGGGGDDGGDGGGEVVMVDADGNITIVAMDNFFDVTRIGVAPGQEIAVLLQNQGSQLHNIAFYDGEDANAGEIATLDLLSGGEEGTLEFTAPGEAGEFFYNCEVHPDQMTGILVVE